MRRSELVEALTGLAVRARDRPARPMVDARSWLLALPARELVRLADVAREGWWSGGALGPAPEWRAVRLERDPVRAALAALHPDGHLRERGVRALAWQDDPVASRVLALVVTDHVPQVRDAGWAALASRTLTEHAREVVPVLVAVRGRPRGFSELERYAALLDDARLAELVPGADRATRLWLYRRLGVAADVRRLEGWLALERDQRGRALLTRALVETAPERAGWLIGSRRSDDRLVALWHLPDAMVGVDAVEQHLLGRSAGIREAARWRYRRVGRSPVGFYAARLDALRDDDPVLPRLLAGLREVAVALPAGVAERLLADPRPAVRLEALRGWAEPDPTRLLDLVLDPSARVARTAALRLGGRARYDDFAGAAAADAVVSRRIALVGRRALGDWSRVRADLEALSDPALGAEALADLRAWLLDRAPTAYSVPEGQDRVEILRLLDLGRLPEGTERVLRFCVR